LRSGKERRVEKRETDALGIVRFGERVIKPLSVKIDSFGVFEGG